MRSCPLIRWRVIVFAVFFALLGGPTALAQESPISAKEDVSGAIFSLASVSPNDFQGSDSERIQQAVDAAAKIGRVVVIPRLNQTGDGERAIWMLDSAILVPSNTTLILVNCHLKLSDECRDNIIRSANCGLKITEVEPLENITIQGIGRPVLEGADHPRATGDSGKTLGKQTYGTDAGKPGESPTGDWRNIGILLAHVDGFRIENIHLKDSHAWAISLERCAQGVIRDVSFDSTGHKTIAGKQEPILNQDGIDLRQGCHDILIENISGRTGDDLIALTTILGKSREPGGTNSTMVTRANNRGDGQDDIRHIIIRNVRGFSVGDHIVRFLNNGGLKIHDVILDGVVDTSKDEPIKAAVKIGDTNYGGLAPPGDTARLMISNVMSRAEHTLLIAGPLSDSSISNVIRHGRPGDALTLGGGWESLKNVSIENVRPLEQLP